MFSSILPSLYSLSFVQFIFSVFLFSLALLERFLFVQGYDVVEIACAERHVVGLDTSGNAIKKAIEVRLASMYFH